MTHKWVIVKGKRLPTDKLTVPLFILITFYIVPANTGIGGGSMMDMVLALFVFALICVF